ncbi:hypothetical protein Amme1_00173 [Pseudomonas phage vB_PpuM-Amme-1]
MPSRKTPSKAQSPREQRQRLRDIIRDERVHPITGLPLSVQEVKDLLIEFPAIN